MRRTSAILGGAITCLVLPGCPATEPPSMAPEAFEPVSWPLVDEPGEPGYVPQVDISDVPPALPPPPVDVTPDDVVAQDVADALRADSATAHEPILVYVADGVVVLGGTVDTLQSQRQAQGIAMAVPGVGSVVNRIRIEAPERRDVQLQIDVQKAMLAEPAVESTQVDVLVDEGLALLTGVVDSEAERALAEHVTAGVPGVTSIENQLQVSIPIERSDEEIETEVSRVLELEPELAEGRVQVEVDDRVVWLSGVVPNQEALELAERLASVSMVRRVDTTGVVIGEAPPRSARAADYR